MIFGRYGDVHKVEMVRDRFSGHSRGFAFVYFNSVRDAATVRTGEESAGLGAKTRFNQLEAFKQEKEAQKEAIKINQICTINKRMPKEPQSSSRQRSTSTTAWWTECASVWTSRSRPTAAHSKRAIFMPTSTSHTSHSIQFQSPCAAH